MRYIPEYMRKSQRSNNQRADSDVCHLVGSILQTACHVYNIHVMIQRSDYVWHTDTHYHTLEGGEHCETIETARAEIRKADTESEDASDRVSQGRDRQIPDRHPARHHCLYDGGMGMVREGVSEGHQEDSEVVSVGHSDISIEVRQAGDGRPSSVTLTNRRSHYDTDRASDSQ